MDHVFNYSPLRWTFTAFPIFMVIGISFRFSLSRMGLDAWLASSLKLSFLPRTLQMFLLHGSRGITTEQGPSVLLHCGFPLLLRGLLSSAPCQDSMKVSGTEQLQPCMRELGWQPGNPTGNPAYWLAVRCVWSCSSGLVQTPRFVTG